MLRVAFFFLGTTAHFEAKQKAARQDPSSTDWSEAEACQSDKSTVADSQPQRSAAEHFDDRGLTSACGSVPDFKQDQV